MREPNYSAVICPFCTRATEKFSIKGGASYPQGERAESMIKDIHSQVMFFKTPSTKDF